MLRPGLLIPTGGARSWKVLMLFMTILLPPATSGCFIKGMAVNSVADALAGGEGGSNVYMTDDDPILVGEALPFSLKLMETILQETPEHQGLLVSAATGFVSYAEMWVLRPARYAEDTDLQASRDGRARAKKLFLRARDYAGRALEVRHPGIEDRLLMDPETAVQELGRGDLAAMYWFAAAHGRAITTDLSDAGLMVEGSTVTAILDRGLELDESWNRGAFHEMYMSIPQQLGGSTEKTELHFAKVMEFNEGESIGPMVSYAEIVHVKRQDQEEFTRTLNQVLAFDADQFPETRLTNILAQEHAEWLLGRADRLFWQDGNGTGAKPDRHRRRIP